MLNLASNAVKFTDEGEVYITVDSSTLDANHVTLHFAIHDTGIGIAPEQIQELFQPFNQLDASNTRKYGGTGLGLSISKRLCALMGGEIWAESQAEKGSVFYFTVNVEVPKEQHSEAYLLPEYKLAQHTALIVDDSNTVQGIIKHYIEAWDMKALVTSSASEALELLTHNGHVDIAIVDLEMPEMDGLAMVSQIRRFRNGLPVVLMAPVSDNNTLNRAKRSWRQFDHL